MWRMRRGPSAGRRSDAVGRLLGAGIGAAILAATAGACSFTSNLDQLDNGACSAGYKACADKCRSVTDPNFGCNLPGCSPCFVANGSANCSQRGTACAIAFCNPGFQDCNNDYTDGCETSIFTDSRHCGDCNIQCTQMVTNGTPGCSSGHCGIGSCSTGWADCDGLVSNGCETPCAAHQTCVQLDGGDDGGGTGWICR